MREAYQANSYDLTVSESRCLTAMLFENCMSTGDLAEKMCVAKSRITRIVDGLVRKGLVSRMENKNDRRVILLKLTQKGRKIAEEQAEFMLQLHKEVLENLPQKQTDSVISMLESLSKSMNEIKNRIESGEFS